MSEAQLSFAMLSASYSFTLKYTQHKPSSLGFLKVLSLAKWQGKKGRWQKKQMKKKDRKEKIKQGSTSMDLEGDIRTQAGADAPK